MDEHCVASFGFLWLWASACRPPLLHLDWRCLRALRRPWRVRPSSRWLHERATRSATYDSACTDACTHVFTGACVGCVSVSRTAREYTFQVSLCLFAYGGRGVHSHSVAQATPLRCRSAVPKESERALFPYASCRHPKGSYERAPRNHLSLLMLHICLSPLAHKAGSGQPKSRSPVVRKTTSAQCRNFRSAKRMKSREPVASLPIVANGVRALPTSLLEVPALPTTLLEPSAHPTALLFRQSSSWRRPFFKPSTSPNSLPLLQHSPHTSSTSPARQCRPTCEVRKVQSQKRAKKCEDSPLCHDATHSQPRPFTSSF